MSFLYFELIFMNNMRVHLYLFFEWMSSFLVPCIEMSVVSLLKGLGSLVDSFGLKCEGLFCLFFPSVCDFVFMPVTHCSYYCSFVVSTKIRKCEAFPFVLLF